MSETKIIPIFPLDLVLFPNQDLPLRIFEPRYKQMVDDCMVGEKEFGICLGHNSATISNWQAPYDIGTIAKIVECKDVDSTSGHLFLNVRGRRKFRIIRLIPPSLQKTENYDTPFHRGKGLSLPLSMSYHFLLPYYKADEMVWLVCPQNLRYSRG